MRLLQIIRGLQPYTTVCPHPSILSFFHRVYTLFSTRGAKNAIWLSLRLTPRPGIYRLCSVFFLFSLSVGRFLSNRIKGFPANFPIDWILYPPWRWMVWTVLFYFSYIFTDFDRFKMIRRFCASRRFLDTWRRVVWKARYMDSVASSCCKISFLRSRTICLFLVREEESCKGVLHCSNHLSLLNYLSKNEIQFHCDKIGWQFSQMSDTTNYYLLNTMFV